MCVKLPSQKCVCVCVCVCRLMEWQEVDIPLHNIRIQIPHDADDDRYYDVDLLCWYKRTNTDILINSGDEDLEEEDQEDVPDRDQVAIVWVWVGWGGGGVCVCIYVYSCVCIYIYIYTARLGEHVLAGRTPINLYSFRHTNISSVTVSVGRVSVTY